MATPSSRVEIDCPRCSGRGAGNWHPDAGICYRCGGKGSVHIDVARHMGALKHLRAKYLNLVRAIRAAEADGLDASQAREALAYCVQDGLRVRADLEAAGVLVGKE